MNHDEALRVCYGIPGWCWPSELSWIYHNVKPSKRHLEVGTYCGKSLAATVYGMQSGSGCCEDRFVYSVDDLRSPEVSIEWTRAVLNATMDHLQKTTSHVSILRLDNSSTDACRILADKKVVFDSVYIDACHHYAECKADIEMFQPFVRKGGMICGHDYCPADLGVMDAVNETGPFNVAADTRIWYRRL